jgi:hypothetical protein
MNPMTVLIEPTGPVAAAQRDLASRHLQGVSSLFALRADLRGVYAFADIVEESVRWSA